MHELSLASSILDVVRESVSGAQRSDVRAVRIRVGADAGVVVDSLRFCFEALVTDTPLSRARLDVESVPVRLHCAQCGEARDVDGVAFACPVCGGADVRRVSGHELDVVAIELVERLAEVP